MLRQRNAAKDDSLFKDRVVSADEEKELSNEEWEQNMSINKRKRQVRQLAGEGEGVVEWL